MTTRVILDGVLGKKFGREWDLICDSPRKALQLIEANKPGLMAFIRKNLGKYNAYKVIVDEYERDTEEYILTCKAKIIRFVPLIAGAGGIGKIVLGAAMVALAIIQPATLAFVGTIGFGVMGSFGLSLMLGGATQLLTKTGSTSADSKSSSDDTSHYFNGPTNTEKQGIGVPLIYGRVLVGSHAISAKMTVVKE